MASLPRLRAGDEGGSGMKFSLCLSFAGFERRVLGQSPDPARLPRLRRPRVPYNRLSFTSPFFRCVLRERAEQRVSPPSPHPLTLPSPSQIATEVRPVPTASHTLSPVGRTCSAAPGVLPDLVLTTRSADAAQGQQPQSKEPVLHGEQGKGQARVHGTERRTDTPPRLGVEIQSHRIIES